MVSKLSSEQAARILGRLDRMASAIQENAEKWGMDFKTAKSLVNALDKTADEIEVATFGLGNFTDRQAQVLDRDSDEKYMETFEDPQAPIQTESDEPYMKAYKDDQSSAVVRGKSTTGRPLAP